MYLRARYYQPAKGRFLTRDTYTGEEDEPESLHLYAYCGNDGVNAWDPSGHWKKPTHKKITNDAIKKANRNLKVHVKRYKIKYKKACDYIKFGSTLPDVVREDFREKKANEYSRIWNIDFMGKDGENNKFWNGSGRGLLNKAQKQVMECVDDMKWFMARNGKIYKNTVKLMYIVIGAALHTTQDYYAHSYILSAKYYRQHYKEFKEDSKEAVYHKDCGVKFNKKNKKAIRISKQYNKSEHKKNKDNEKKDFINGNWKKCSYKRNNRIKNSIGESVGFLKYVTG